MFLAGHMDTDDQGALNRAVYICSKADPLLVTRKPGSRSSVKLLQQQQDRSTRGAIACVNNTSLDRRGCLRELLYFGVKPTVDVDVVISHTLNLRSRCVPPPGWSWVH